jgi:site-specific recombinase XerD
MSSDVPVVSTDSLTENRRATAEFLKSSKADATRVAYAADWRDFEAWCGRHDFVAIPADPENVAVYLSSLATSGRKVSTIRRRCAAIAHVHRTAGASDNPSSHPGVKSVLAGITRKLGSAPAKKAALTVQMLERVVRKIPDNLAGIRDRALLLTGFAGALRRSELVALDVADVARHHKGIVLTLRRSKTDQAGVGKTKAIPHGKRLKVVAALDAWLEALKNAQNNEIRTAGQNLNGPIFRGVRGSRTLPGRLSTNQVALIIKARAKAVGLDPKVFAGHSLRSGFVTSAADSGASLQSIADHAAHKKLDTTLGYVQIADAFRDHSGKRFL